MKMKTMLMVALLCMIGANVSALVDLNPVEDAYISCKDLKDEFGVVIGNERDTAFGLTDPSALQASQSGVNAGGRKTYLKWDASAYAPASITGIGDLKFYHDAGATVSRAIDVWLLTRSDGLETWSEDTITWTNAPFNDWGPTGTANNFNNYGGAGELTPLRVGSFGVSSYGWYTTTWGDIAHGGTTTPEAAIAAVLAALTTGDQKVTLGLTYRGSQDRTYVFVSKDDIEFPDLAPILQIVPEPATLVLLGLGGLSLLRKRK